MRKQIVIGAVAAVVVGAAVAGALGLGGSHPQPPTTKVTLATTTVSRCTLTSSQTASGRVSFGTARPLPIQRSGTLTWLPKPGAVVTEGNQLIRVNDRPTLLLYGTLPQYRALAPAHRGQKPLSGADVTELEAGLNRLGYFGLNDDDVYSGGTVDAVKRWQRSLGEAPTGVVALGDLYYANAPLRVVPAAQVRVGDQMTPQALTATSRTARVIASVPATSLWAKPGTRIKLRLAGAVTVHAAINAVTAASSNGAAGSSGGDGPSTLRIEVRVAKQGALLKTVTHRITITHVSARRTNVLCVPVSSLVALANGGYGLQLAGQASARYVAVKTGLFAQGKVEVSGPAVAAGMSVSMPIGE
jgi:peptidoglycan hydrolase-like protein with peptidoglycan-binding domain